MRKIDETGAILPTRGVVSHFIEVEPDNKIQDALGALARAIGALLRTEGLVFPCHVTSLASNGTGHITRFAEAGEAITLARHEESEGVRLPIHAIFLDGAGYTTHLIVGPKLEPVGELKSLGTV